jgi:CheY-specific phosphatase CheX
MTPMSNDALAVLAASTFADTAFLLTEPADEHNAWSDDWLCAVIPFDGEVAGRLVLAAPTSLAVQVAADMLCLDPGDAEAMAHAGSAVAELANVLAGALVAELFGSSGKWQLGLPRITLLEPAVAPGEQANRVTLLNELGWPIRVEVVLANAA